MSLADLLKKGRIRRVDADAHEVKSLLGVAQRDLEVSRMLLGKNSDASFMHSYNCILQCCRAAMFSQGYRAVEDEHKTAIEFAAIMMPAFAHISELDRMRRKRHIATYDEADTVSKQEAEHAIEVAEGLYALVENKVRRLVG